MKQLRNIIRNTGESMQRFYARNLARLYARSRGCQYIRKKEDDDRYRCCSENYCEQIELYCRKMNVQIPNEQKQAGPILRWYMSRRYRWAIKWTEYRGKMMEMPPVIIRSAVDLDIVLSEWGKIARTETDKVTRRNKEDEQKSLTKLEGAIVDYSF